MRFIIFAIQITLISTMTVGLLSSCNGTNVDAVTERSCSEAEGLWTITEVTCNGEARTITPETFLFNNTSTGLTQTQGRVDCATQLEWTVEVGSETPIFSMTGNGTQSCSALNVDTPSCSSEVNICDAGADYTGIRNEYPTCVITSDGMSLVRTVSAVNDPGNLSFCDDGQAEVITLRQGDYVPPVPEPEPDEELAFIDVAGTNPTDFGTHPVGSRTTQVLTLTNTGNSAATSLMAEGLTDPFLFVGSSYPGTGGNCADTLAVGESCTIVIEFFPMVANFYTSNLRISYNNGEQNVLINQGLAGTSSQNLALLSISESGVYSYGSIDIGLTQSHVFTVTNSGGVSATAVFEGGIAAPFQFTGGAYPGTAGTCGNAILMGASCTIEIEFAPVADGPFNDVIEVNYLDGVNNQTATRNIFGRGVTP